MEGVLRFEKIRGSSDERRAIKLCSAKDPIDKQSLPSNDFFNKTYKNQNQILSALINFICCSK